MNGDAKGSGRRRGRTGARGSGIAALAALALALPAGAFALAGRQHAADIPISLGDVVKVTGAPIGCIVRQHNGERTLDCRRAGQLRGTYGTLLTKSEVLVVRFESPKLAKIVFQARHDHLGARMCGSR